MAKLYFRYGAMNSGKTTVLLQTAHNYEERDKKVVVIKPAVDTKGGDYIMNRIGLKRKVDELIKKEDSIIKKLEKYMETIDCILVDEAELLTVEQAEELFCIPKIYEIPVIAYGLRTNFKGTVFPASQILLSKADELEELPTICRCGKKARFNGRKINGIFVNEGEDVLIDGSDSKVEYESICGKCFVEKVLKKEIKK